MYVTVRDGSGAGSNRRTAGRKVGISVVLLGLVSLTTDVSSESVNAVLPTYLTTVLGLSPFAFGVIDGVYQGVSALVRIVGGWLADRSDHPKRVAVFGYGLSAVSRLFLLPAQTFGSFLSIITVDRLGKGLRTAPRDAMIAAASDPADLGRAFGVHRTLDTLGALIGPLLAFGVLLAVPHGYHSVFVASAAFGLIGVALLVLVVPDIRPRRDTAAPAPTPRVSIRLLLDARLGRLLAAAGILGVLTISDGFLYLQLADRGSISLSYFPLLYVGTNLAYLAFAVPLGRLADRIGRGTVLIGGHVLLLGSYLSAGGPWTGAVASVLCLALLGVYYAATDGILAAIAAQVAAPEIRTSAIATAQTVVSAARFVSALGFGLFWTLVGRQPAMLVTALALAVAIPFAARLLHGMRPALDPSATP